MTGFGLGMSMRISQQLALRQSLEENLQLVMATALKMTMELYQEREDVCTKLYRKSLEKGNVYLYKKHGLEFEFALVSKKDVPEWIYENMGCAFSQCLMNGFDALIMGKKYALAKGSWLLFVISDFYPQMPQEVIEYSAVHEYGEMVTLGKHHLASKLEFAIAQKDGRLRWYIDWLEKNNLEKFANVYNYREHLTLPDSKEFQEILEIFQNSERVKCVCQMIEQFEWPYSILQKLSKYQKANDKIIQLFGKAFQMANMYAAETGIPISQTVEKIKEILGKTIFKAKQKGLLKYITPLRINKYWHDQRIELDRIFLKQLQNIKAIMEQSDFVKQVTAADIGSGLPDKEVLSIDFFEALKYI